MPISLKSTRWRDALEVIIQVFIFYSVIMHLVEIEFAHGHHGTGYFFNSPQEG